MWYVWFKINGEVARLEKCYKTKANASKLGKKIFAEAIEWAVGEENPFI